MYYIIIISFFSLLFLIRKKESPADYNQYVDIFNYSQDYIYQNEYGYWFLNLIFIYLGFSAQSFLFLVTYFILLIYSLSAYRMKIQGGYFLFFLSIPSFLLFAVNGIRQGIAMSLILFGISLGGFKSLLIFLIAISFHTSAFPIIIFSLIFKIYEKYKNSLIILPFIGLLFGFLIEDVLLLSKTFFSYKIVEYNNSNIFYIRFLTLYVFYFYIYKYLLSDRKLILLDTFIISSLFISSVSFNNELFSSRYLYYSELFIVLRLLLILQEKKFVKQSLAFCISIIFFAIIFYYPSIYKQYF